MNKRFWILKSLLWVLFVSNLSGFVCREPFFINFTDRTTNSLRVSWQDANLNSEFYELAYVLHGKPLANATIISGLPIKQHQINGLDAATHYDVYVRSRCDDGEFSRWGGPYEAVTVIDNGVSCDFNIGLNDNNCGTGGQQFFIQNNMAGRLGEDLSLQSVDLIIDHNWPADLQVILKNPAGNFVELSNFNGTITDHFGDPSSECLAFTTFSDQACESIKDGTPPFVGSFQPETTLASINDQSLAQGLWSLEICDNTPSDIGTLQYVRLNFDDKTCQGVTDFGIDNLTDTEVSFTWNRPNGCEVFRVLYNKVGEATQISTIDCSKRRITISGLEPDAEYEFSVVSDCLTSESAPSCTSSFKTNCAAPQIISNFNNQTLCDQSCSVPCAIEGNWFNTNGDDLDWVVNNGSTPSPETGPRGDVFNNGNYLYVESNDNVCGTDNLAILRSSCVQLGIQGSCDMSFYVHMSGSEIGKIELFISEDDGETFTSIFDKVGSQGSLWTQHFIDLSPYNGKQVSFKFEVRTGEGDKGDIALDQIVIFNGQFIEDGTTYYRDSDNDGFGEDTMSMVLCSADVPAGFTTEGGDCQDNNPNINPGATEITCNLIDENCNGIEDDQPINNPIEFTTEMIKQESCRGMEDGAIKINVSGGTAPYSITWSNGMTGDSIGGLSQGRYNFVIQDLAGCRTMSDFIEVPASSSIEIFVIDRTQPNCNTSANGSITIEANGGLSPYDYVWEDGSTGPNRDQLGQGLYKVTATDSEGCEFSRQINLNSRDEINTTLLSKRNNDCFGDSRGRINVIVQEAALPYSTVWSNGDTTTNISNLSAGSYTLSITDNDGCTSVDSFTISQPDSLRIDIVELENLVCADQSNGQVRIKANGGVKPYNYVWSDGSFGTALRDIKSGEYSVTVFDNNGCSQEQKDILVDSPDALSLEIDSIIHATCRLSNNGRISTSISGGSPPYTFLWRGVNGDSSEVENLLANTYGLTVFDNNFCKISIENIDVEFGNEPFDIETSLAEANKCAGDQDAIISISTDNDNLPLDYNWSNGVKFSSSNTDTTLANLSSGTYNVTITDQEGCFSIAKDLTIDRVNPIMFQVLESKNNLCFGDSTGSIQLMVQGGTGELLTRWDELDIDGTELSDLPNGIYNFTITDENGCTSSGRSVVISSPDDIAVTHEIQHQNPGAEDGSVKVDPQGGVAPYDISWGHTIAKIFELKNLKAGRYDYNLIDDNGCMLDTFAIVDIASTVDEVDRNFTIHPNPTTDRLFITYNGGSLNEQGIVLSADQKHRIRFDIKKTQTMLDLQNLPAGLYFLRVGREVYKFIKI